MQVVSVNAGLPREVIWRGRRLNTAIFKIPVDGAIAVRRLNLDGDRQADLTVHGGPQRRESLHRISLMLPPLLKLSGHN
jgi:MOSC domain-containing protein YiiM